MTSRWQVVTSNGRVVFGGTKAECKAYVKDALKKGTEEDYLHIVVNREAKK